MAKTKFLRQNRQSVHREGNNALSSRRRNAISCDPSVGDKVELYDKRHVWFKIANITHALLVPVYQQTNFTPKWVVVPRLHDTVARFRTGVKFSPRCENRGELTPGSLPPA